MTPLTVEDGKLVVRDGALGTEQACCCAGAGECNCEASCDGTFELEIEGNTLPGFSGMVLCTGGSGEYFTVRQVAWNYVGCVDGKRRVSVQVSTNCSYDRCTRFTNFLYEFQTCDEDGCPSEDGVLIETTVFPPPPSTPCPDAECVDHDCETITAPTAVRYSPLP